MSRQDKRPDGRPWTVVRSTAELREAEERGWSISQIALDDAWINGARENSVDQPDSNPGRIGARNETDDPFNSAEIYARRAKDRT